MKKLQNNHHNQDAERNLHRFIYNGTANEETCLYGLEELCTSSNAMYHLLSLCKQNDISITKNMKSILIAQLNIENKQEEVTLKIEKNKK